MMLMSHKISGSHGMQMVYDLIQNMTLLFYIMLICLKH